MLPVEQPQSPNALALVARREQEARRDDARAKSAKSLKERLETVDEDDLYGNLPFTD